MPRPRADDPSNHAFMANLDPQIADEVAAHCQTTAGEIGQAFTRAFGGAVAVGIESTGTLDFAQMADGLAGPGLAIVLHIGEVGVAVFIAEKSGILPQWYKAPDTSGQSRLTTLGQELGMLALPEPFMPDDTRAFAATDLPAALREGGAAEGAGLVRLTLTSGDRQGTVFLVWPLASPRAIKSTVSTAAPKAVVPGDSTAGEEQDSNNPAIDSPSPAEDIDPVSAGIQREAASIGADSAFDAGPDVPLPLNPPRPYPPQWPKHIGPTFRDLPPYTRSLLKIRVPLSVTLAAKRQPVGQILEIGPGSIIQFEKSCEEMLDLNVSNLAIARGEAVKVGEKFGLRVTSLILPGERFKPVRPV